MAGRRPSGDGMIRQKKKGLWEGRITVGHKNDGTPIFRYVYGKTQKEALEKMHQRIEDYRGVELTEDSNMTDMMQMQAAVNIDRKIGKTDAQMPKTEKTPKPQIKTANSGDFEPIPRKIRKQGTGCVFQINENLWEGSYFPRLPGGKRKKFNVYARTKDECEKLLAEMIKKKKEEIKEEKEKLRIGR